MQIKAVCVERLRNDNGVVFKYILKDYTGKLKEFEPEQLKNALRTEQIIVDNLILTETNEIFVR